ncbi:hypothetical protein NEF87_002165 [Candidatus Lokiarchaeum ossiferum]|uniref:Yip1 domain-containing protein n=1 Tax=Candidatus Lokiarchaeum ossiferum TaxID=2951803 RepID=A0ABY6HQU5_9ARCH|nr:hypothetical protein NEF87_002165 [Candidatus Lokiarchaeum sp. B-35]
MSFAQYENAAPHTLQALENMRNWEMLEWYAIPMLGIMFYIYAKEIQKARTTKNWDPLFCAVTVMGVVFFNETWNSWVAWFTGKSAIWTTPGDTAFLIMFGINFEILCLFLINGFTYANLIDPDEKKKFLGIPNWWFYGILVSGFSVLVEHMLNSANLLVWYFSFWDRDFWGFWIILWIGYFLFYLACILVLRLKSTKKRLIAVGSIYAVPIIMNIIAAILGMVY